MTVRRLQFGLLTLVVCLTVGGAVTLAFLSLRWPVEIDLPIMLYEGFLIDDIGLVPYRDFFEMNPPGTMLLYTGFHVLTGGASVPCRVIDLVILTAIGGFIFLTLRRIDIYAGILAASCFALVYLGTNRANCLQREYFCLLPLSISTAMVLSPWRFGTRAVWVPALLGFLAGVAATIKPPVVLCWVPLAGYWVWSTWTDTQRTVRYPIAATVMPAILATCGLLVPLITVGAWLYSKGGLSRYVEILFDYYPLYAQIEGDGRVAAPGLVPFLQRYFVMTARVFAEFPYVAVASIGAMIGLTVKDRQVLARVITIAMMVLCALLYIPVGGKFFFYHRIPFWFAMSLLAGFAFYAHPSFRGGRSVGHLVVVLVAIASALPYDTLMNEFTMAKTGMVHRPENGRMNAIAEYLDKETNNATTVLPLDVFSGGAIHAMYRTRRRLYGGFIYDFHYYHHTEHPFVQALRKEILSRFTDTAPEVIIDCESWRPYGYGCSAEFPELKLLIESRYTVAREGTGFRILRRTVQTPP